MGFSLVALHRWKDDVDRPWQTLGLALDRIAAFDAVAGFGIGALVMMGIFFVQQATRLIHVSGQRSLYLFILSGFLWFFPRAFAEELFCRGFMLNGIFILFRGKQKWLAVAISAIAFGFIHALNHYASGLSILGNALGGVVYAVAYLRSGGLWLGTGLHFAWNFVQGTILGFPVSGNVTASLVLQATPGDNLLTGGGYGPEAGLIGMGFRFVAILGILLWSGSRQNRGIRESKISNQ